MAVTLKDLVHLKNALAEDVVCRYRGCKDDGIYWMRRPLRYGRMQEGFFCDAHEEEFGEANLQRWADGFGVKVVWLEDDEGRYRGVDAEFSASASEPPIMKYGPRRF